MEGRKGVDMRLRILQTAVTPLGPVKAGNIMDIPDPPASDWLKSGLAMQDKSIQPSEHKEEITADKSVKTKRKIKHSKRR
jgi:hypothetical protein